jgi:hypothetical protein
MKLKHWVIIFIAVGGIVSGAVATLRSAILEAGTPVIELAVPADSLGTIEAARLATGVEALVAVEVERAALEAQRNQLLADRNEILIEANRKTERAVAQLATIAGIMDVHLPPWPVGRTSGQ